MNNLEKIVFKLIDEKTADCDKYNNNGSLWLIFTNKKRWVLEYTDQGVLWYNYTFFNDIFSWLGLTDKKNEYITKWFESRFLGIGVKHTNCQALNIYSRVEDTIQNGVKDIRKNPDHPQKFVEDTIKSSVKDIKKGTWWNALCADDIIENRVKHTEDGDWLDGDERIDEIIENGVKQ